MTSFTLSVRFNDGRVVDLDEHYDAQCLAELAARTYVRAFSDRCGLDVPLDYVSVHRHEIDYDVTVGIFKRNDEVQ